MNMAEELAKLVKTNLIMGSPVLSGNLKMQNILTQIQPYGNGFKLIISAPLYDVKKWKKTGMIQPIKPSPDFPNITDYAMWLNDRGAFNTHNRSEHWANRSIVQACLVYANQIGAEVINELEL